MKPALAYFCIRSGRIPSDANITTLSTGRPSPFLAMADPAPSVSTIASAVALQSAGASKRRLLFMSRAPFSPLEHHSFASRTYWVSRCRATPYSRFTGRDIGRGGAARIEPTVPRHPPEDRRSPSLLALLLARRRVVLPRFRGLAGLAGLVRLVRLRLLRGQHCRKVVHGRVARAERCELVAVLERRDDRRRVVLAAVDDERVLQVRRENQRRNPRSRAPDVVRPVVVPLTGRRDVIPLTAELVVRDDHHRVLRAAAPLDPLEQVHEVVAAVRLARVAGVLVLGSERLHEADVGELAFLCRRTEEVLELDLVAKVLLAVLLP